jgi:hypothetical protein|tara:strand:- start:241 stop:630 length:390 start_codon:yes stop_codon:yes gene_type:complete
VLAENEVINSAMWFFLGAFLYATISSILFSARSLLLVEETIINCLNVVWYSDKSYETLLKIKYDLMRAGKSEDQLYQERESDELVRDTWRRMTIYGIINSCPKNFRAAVKFNDWRTAMKYLRKHQKEVA